jgi:hypothetical protein
MSKQIYILNEEEVLLIDRLNEGRTNLLLMVCAYNEHLGILLDDLQKPEYSDYLDVLGGEILPEKIVEI